ncbi:MAG TPA: DUF1015 domain-containing protein [Candidatus Aquilonibacter sp.]|nr:DUF1015 domain-containing protein [Candidatus Aquilonibacter sp.]
MARLFPFRALRYDPTCVNMADVVTQPYDKIDKAMQDRYYNLSPYNLVRVVLGKHQPEDDDEHNVYTRAAETLKKWRAEHILREESTPAIYGYSQTYTVPGTGGNTGVKAEIRERRGFIALGQLYDYADKVVYRHEQTFPKHKSDRLALFKATRAYCEQIYMLYSDPTFAAEHAIFDTPPPTVGDSATVSHVSRTPDLEIVDEYHVVHRLWMVTDARFIQRVLDAMKDKWLLIADGHHRYETSVAYMHERADEQHIDAKAPPKMTPDGLPQPAFPEQAMMMTFVNMDAPGITILPTHRVVSGLENFKIKEFAERAKQYFDVDELPAGLTPAELLARLNATHGIAFVAAAREGNLLLTPKAEATAPLLKNLSPRQAQLDVTQLHKIVIEKLLGMDEEKVRKGENIRYYREAGESVERVMSGKADVAFLIKPVTLEQMKDISLNLEVMPQKSTDFYPKLLSGLAMYTLQ